MEWFIIRGLMYGVLTGMVLIPVSMIYFKYLGKFYKWLMKGE